MPRFLTALAAALSLAVSGCGEAAVATGSANDCSACHAFPPPEVASHATAPGGTWEPDECATCHSTSVDAANGDVIPTSDGGTHADGKVDAGGAHAVPYPSAEHGPAALANIGACKSCHGADLLGGTAGVSCNRCHAGWQTNCSFCHDFPPPAVASHATAPGGTWEATECASCHSTSVDEATGGVLPTSAGGTHWDGKVDAAAPHGDYTNPAVHGPAANLGIATCQACHGTALDGGTSGQSCLGCHTGAIAFTNCTLCHGTRVTSYGGADLPKSAPPADVGGAIAVTEVTVGVHQAHVTAANPVGCAACHSATGTTPADIFAAGHVDASPAEVPFGALAKTRGRTPTWNRTSATCSSTWCHAQGGSAPTPNWTVAATVGCGSCHPAAPTTNSHGAHLAGETYSNGFACSGCHTVPASTSHLNGTVAVAFPGVGGTPAAGTFAGTTCTNTYCHGTFTGGSGADPTWTGAITCTSCHGRPPSTGEHSKHVNGEDYGCERCHEGYTSTFSSGSLSNVTIGAAGKAIHVNGAKNVAAVAGWNGSSCSNSCHGTGKGTWY